jgi:beta-glucanase (GH16 family)
VRIRLLLVVALLAWLPAIPAAAQAPASPAQQWQLVAADDFSGSLAPHWSAYQGSPACCRATTWKTSEVAVKDGRLVLTTQRDSRGQWIAGGVSAAGWPAAVRTYGKYVARIRVDKGQGISAVALLWPKSNAWPPEIDYYELSGADGDRTQETATAHRAPDDAKQQSVYQGDLTQWHTVSMEWLPTSITYFVDNKVIGRVTDPSYIPHEPMWPAFQMQIQEDTNGRGMATATAPAHLYVDAFDIYAPVTPTPPSAPSNPGSSLWIAVALIVAVLLVASLVIRRVRRRLR